MTESRPHSTFSRLDAIKTAWIDAEVEDYFIAAQMDITYLFEQLEEMTRLRDGYRDEKRTAIAALRSLEEQLEEMRDDATEGLKAAIKLEAAMDCMNYAWTIICNVSEGDWTRQSTEWHKAAARCRDQYHALLDSNPAGEEDDG